MGQRVLTTDSAREAVTAMQGVIQGLREQITRLDQKGQVLSQPDVWDGPKAAQFRSDIWPGAKSTLDKIAQELEQLRNTVQQINSDIMSAGS